MSGIRDEKKNIIIFFRCEIRDETAQSPLLTFWKYLIEVHRKREARQFDFFSILNAKTHNNAERVRDFSKTIASEPSDDATRTNAFTERRLVGTVCGRSGRAVFVARAKRVLLECDFSACSRRSRNRAGPDGTDTTGYEINMKT